MNNYFEDFDELLKELDLKNYVSFVNKCFKGGIKKNEETICAQDLRNLAKCLPRVSGVWYDLHKNSWEARWSEGTKSARKYYSVQKFGFHEARKLAIKTIKTKEINYLYNSINEDFNKPLKWNLNNDFLEMNHDPTINLKKKCRAKNCKIKEIKVKKENNNINKKIKYEKKNYLTKSTKKKNPIEAHSKKNENCEIKKQNNANYEEKSMNYSIKRTNYKFAVKNKEHNKDHFSDKNEMNKNIQNNLSKDSILYSSNKSEEINNNNQITIKDVVSVQENQNILKGSNIYINEKELINKNNNDILYDNQKVKTKGNINNIRNHINVKNNGISNTNKINNTVTNLKNNTIFSSNYINEMKNEKNTANEKKLINKIINQYYEIDKICDTSNKKDNDFSKIGKNSNKENNKTNLIKFPCEKILSYILYHNKPYSKNSFYNKQLELLKINIKNTKNYPVNKENKAINNNTTNKAIGAIKILNSTDKNISINNNSNYIKKLKNYNSNFFLAKKNELDEHAGCNNSDNFQSIQIKKKKENSSVLINDKDYKEIGNNKDNNNNNSIIFKNEPLSSNQNIPHISNKNLNNISQKNACKNDILREKNTYFCNNICCKKNENICNEKKEKNGNSIKLNLKDPINFDTLSIFKNAINLLLKDLKYKCVPHFDKPFFNILEIIDNHLSYVNSIFNENFLITYVHLFDICVSNNILPSQMDQKIQKVFCNALIAFHILLFNFHKEKKIN